MQNHNVPLHHYHSMIRIGYGWLKLYTHTQQYEYHHSIQQFCHSRALQGFFPFFMMLTGYWTHTEGFSLSKSQQLKQVFGATRAFPEKKIYLGLFLACSIFLLSFYFITHVFVSPFATCYFAFTPLTANFSKSLSLPSAFWTFKRCGYTHVVVVVLQS